MGFIDPVGLGLEEAATAMGAPPWMATIAGIGIPDPGDVARLGLRRGPDIARGIRGLPEVLKAGMRQVFDPMSGQFTFQDPMTRLAHGVGQLRPEEGLLELTNIGRGQGKRTLEAFDELAELLGLQVTRGTTQLKEKGAESLKKALEKGHAAALQKGIPVKGKKFPALSTAQPQGLSLLIDQLFELLQGGA
jgi:hypothetical protein